MKKARRVWMLLSLAAVLSVEPLTLSAQNTPEEKLSMAMYAIMNMYVDSVDKSRFVDQQIDRMLQQLDPFSMYLPAQQASAKEQAVLALPMDGANSGSANASQQGERGKPTDNPKTTLRHYMLDGQTGYIQLPIFSQTAARDFRNSVAALKSSGMKNLVLDLRNNHGGLTDAAVAVADELLDGEKTVFTAVGAHIEKQVFKTQHDGCFEHGQLAVLTNGETMSAAELFAGAIQDWDRGIVVGESTFGKGLIQETLPLADGSAIQISVARYLTPAGRSLQKPYQQQAPDSTMHHTLLSHRPLKSACGIEPDVPLVSFPAPYDSPWYVRFLLSRASQSVAAEFVDKHGRELLERYQSPSDFVSRFPAHELQEAVMTQSASMSMTPTDDDLRKSMERVLLETKAYVGRALFQSDQCYYQVIATNSNPAAEHFANRVLRTAWQLVCHPAEYKKILEP